MIWYAIKSTRHELRMRPPFGHIGWPAFVSKYAKINFYTSFPRAARRFKTSEAAHRHLTKLRARGLMAGGKVVRWQP